MSFFKENTSNEEKLRLLIMMADYIEATQVISHDYTNSILNKEEDKAIRSDLKTISESCALGCSDYSEILYYDQPKEPYDARLVKTM